MKPFKKLSYEREEQIKRYQINTKVSFKDSLHKHTIGIIVKHTDQSKQVAVIRELNTLEIYNRSLNHLDLNNEEEIKDEKIRNH